MKELEAEPPRPSTDLRSHRLSLHHRRAASEGHIVLHAAHDGDRLVLVLNPDHPFYREIYKPLADGDSPRDQQFRAKLELAVARRSRGEAIAKGKEPTLARHRLEWSNTLAAFLNSK